MTAGLAIPLAVSVPVGLLDFSARVVPLTALFITSARAAHPLLSLFNVVVHISLRRFCVSLGSLYIRSVGVPFTMFFISLIVQCFFLFHSSFGLRFIFMPPASSRFICPLGAPSALVPSSPSLLHPELSSFSGDSGSFFELKLNSCYRACFGFIYFVESTSPYVVCVAFFFRLCIINM